MRITNQRLRVTAVVACACAVFFSAGLGTTTASQAGTTVPNPIKVVARWSARKLGLHHPTQTLAIGRSGNLYVTDDKDRVTEISPKGKVLRRWGKRGAGRGQFHFVTTDPTGNGAVHGAIAVGPDGKVYVSDSGNARVEVFSAKGRFIRQFGSFGEGAGQFLSPFDLAVDQAGNVYVTDDQRFNLQKFSPAGKVAWATRGDASSDPDLVGHLHLDTIDRHGRLVLTNDDKARVLYLDQGGHKVDAFGSHSEFGSSACNVTVDTAGFTYVDGCYSPNVTYVFDPSHRLVGRWARSPLSIAPRFGPHGEIFALTWNGTLLKLRITHPSG
jgi:DNA-binding beta-propeller fold protein YncE